MRNPEIMLLSCYELGHQPLSLAWPLAALQADGHRAAGVDLAVEAFPVEMVREADFVGVAVPMHTAMRLGVQAARRVRRLNPAAHICFYGLYAGLNRHYLLNGQNGHGPLADSVISGEYEAPLCALVAARAAGKAAETVAGVATATRAAPGYKERIRFPVPNRSDLPDLNHYAHYMYAGQALPAGYVESTRGCLHTCRHCPVVPVYQGRFFAVPAETVMADVRQQVAAGARHITFGDPDFLNGPGHALKVTRALHEEFPEVTFDFTTKVEHILENREHFKTLKERGASFVISAFESISDEVLARLKKGHSVDDMEEALAILAEVGLAVQPTWLPFTPWTTLAGYRDLLAWIRQHQLIPHVPAVQLSIRLLVPPRSALLEEAETSAWLGPLDVGNFTYRWRHPDSRMDDLQNRVAAIAERQGNEDPYGTFQAIERLAYEMAGLAPPDWSPPPVPDLPPPRLTEDWFC